MIKHLGLHFEPLDRATFWLVVFAFVILETERLDCGLNEHGILEKHNIILLFFMVFIK